MKSVLICFCLALGGGLLVNSARGMIDTGSAYERLRVQFDRAQKPEASDLFTGSVWYCSGSLEAAKGQFRYVPFWEARYQFQLQYDAKGFYTNGMDPAENWFQESKEDLRGVRVLSPQVRQYEFLRRNRQGDLLIEVASTKVSGAHYGRQAARLSPSVSSRELIANEYVICENPTNHENKNWGAKPFDQIEAPSF